tara:strand:+ start:423 stop:644 length:222 start_codon:yes stop_codon:yes gene_type:complete
MTAFNKAWSLIKTEDEIHIVWSVDDVMGHIPRLTREQARSVLHEAHRTHDAEYGVAWVTFEIIADEMFPIKEE